jgi:hypothetical protein
MKSNNIITSPVVSVLWPNLVTPNTKFNEKGVYDVTMILSPNDPEHAEFIAQIEAHYNNAYTAMCKEHNKPKLKKADSPLTPVTNAQGMETGDLKLKAKLTASGETKDGRRYERKPALFDQFGKPWKGGVIGNGSRLRVAIQPNPFFVPALGAGLSLRLEAVQVVEAREGGRSFNEYGFIASAESDSIASQPSADTFANSEEEF